MGVKQGNAIYHVSFLWKVEKKYKTEEKKYMPKKDS